MREVTYNRKLNRPLKKFTNNVKWLHFSKRFEIFQEANDKVNEFRLQGELKFKEFLETYRIVLEDYLIKEEKDDQGWGLFLGELLSVTEDDPYPSLSNIKDYPPIIPTTKSEMMDILKRLSIEYKIEWSEKENIQGVLYGVENVFKIIFENQSKLFPSITTEPTVLRRAKSADSDGDDTSLFKGSHQKDDTKNVIIPLNFFA